MALDQTTRNEVREAVLEIVRERPMDVLDIVAEWLEANGYDGLADDLGECACLNPDLAPCGDIQGSCVAGMRAPCECGEGHDFHIIPGKPREAKDD